MAFPSICAIVLNWNATEDTLECLDSLSRLNDPLNTIILVDNGSEDCPEGPLLDWAKYVYPNDLVRCVGVDEIADFFSEIPAFLFVRNPVNAGFAGGNNIGIRYAMDIGTYEFVWILNNDTWVSPSALSCLVHCLEDNARAGIAGSTVVHYANPHRVQCAGGCRYNPWTTVNRPLLADQPLPRVLRFSGPLELDYIYGASMFVRTSVFEKCGMLNEDYFLFYEEIDFCKKAEKEGFQLTWCPKSIVLHKGSQSIKSLSPDDTKSRSAFANYHENLSALLYARSLHPLVFIFSLVFRFFGKIAVLTGSNNVHLIRPLLDAYIDFFKDRKYNQKKRFI
jgi:hypothetical protein